MTTSSQRLTATYDPSVFDMKDMASARAVILTDGDDFNSEERWKRETPYLRDLICRSIDLSSESIVLDYGCGIGRLAGELIQRTGCTVIGVDISPSMRALASAAVPSERFVACHPDALKRLRIRFDAAIAVWVLQHCVRPELDIAAIKTALDPRAPLFVVNANHRCVPTKEHPWVDDGIDVNKLLSARFNHIRNGELDPAIVGKDHHQQASWSLWS